MEYKIYITYHKDNNNSPWYSKVDLEKYFNSEAKSFKYINTEDLQYINPNDFILKLHPFFNEFITQYFIARYCNKLDYVGFCHYSRLLQPKLIDFNKLSEGYIQFWSYSQDFKHIKFDMNEIPIIKYYDIFIDKPQCNSKFIYDDVKEYINNQTIIDKRKIYKAAQTKYFPNREMYICRYDIFLKLVKFILGFILFILKKYNIQTVHEFEIHMIKNSLLYNGYDNIYRAYGYHIEILIGLFILCFKYFYNGKFIDLKLNRHIPTDFQMTNNQLNFYRDINNYYEVPAYYMLNLPNTTTDYKINY